MIKLQKATAFEKLAASHKDAFYSKEFIVSKKYDGHCIIIDNTSLGVKLYTSNGKQFSLGNFVDNTLSRGPKGLYVAEFMWDCEGNLGDRTKSAILTTFRTNFAKGIPSDGSKAVVRVFDSIIDGPYKDRLRHCSDFTIECKGLMLDIATVEYRYLTGEDAIYVAKKVTEKNWEGLMACDPNEIYREGKRVPYNVKLKFRKTADLLCIDVEQGIGKCQGIGALVLRDKAGRIVKVGSGLDYSSDTRDGSKFVGKVIEISYEQILDTYIQPVFVCIRDDKTWEDID